MSLSYDDYLDRELEKHQTEDIGTLSNCCHEEIDIRGLCSYCYERCITVEEFRYNVLSDKADERYEDEKMSKVSKD